jgi:hypothetical protein
MELVDRPPFLARREFQSAIQWFRNGRRLNANDDIGIVGVLAA